MTTADHAPRRGLRSFLLVPALVLAASSAHAAGETITVTTLADVVDFGGAQEVGDLPGPDGRVSFREAVAAVNNTAGPQTIAFAIPPSEFWLVPGVALLKIEGNSFFLTDDATTVDFSTQAAAFGDTNPNGAEVGFYGLQPNGAGTSAIYVNGDNCLLRGLGDVHQRGYAIALQGNANQVVGCTISGPLFAAVYVNGSFNGAPATGNVIGGTGPGEGNELSAGNSGVRIDGPALQNVVIGNTLSGSFFGVEVRTPTCCPGNDAVANRIGGPSPAERNVIAGAGKYGEEGFPTGGQVAVQYSTGTIVEGNYIGVLADGLTVPAIQRGPVGVELRASPNSTVRGNVIAGIRVAGVNHYQGQIFGDGIRVIGDCEGSAIEHNTIGLGADGTTPVPNRNGIAVSWFPGTVGPGGPGPVTIGGRVGEGGNVVAHNEVNGVRVDPQMRSVRVTGNSIHSNGSLGIDLFAPAGSGVTPNDPGDADSGGNQLQNYPVVLSAMRCEAKTRVAGTLDSTPSTTFTLEFFSNAVCDPSGFGEGQTFLGSTVVVTDAAGHASFDVLTTKPAPLASFVTATATDAGGNTSEFSACRPVTACERMPMTRLTSQP